MRGNLGWLLLGVAALTAGVAAHWSLRASQTVPNDGDAPALSDLDGNSHALAEWRGQVLVVNFWASWCEPCREEIPTLTRLHQQWRDTDTPIRVLGIALDEPGAVREFLASTPINYPLRIGGKAAEAWSTRLGNRFSVLPFTVVLDGHGTPLKTWVGPFAISELEETLRVAKNAAN